MIFLEKEDKTMNYIFDIAITLIIIFVVSKKIRGTFKILDLVILFVVLLYIFKDHVYLFLRTILCDFNPPAPPYIKF